MSRIIVKNLPASGVRESELKKHFEDVGNVTDIKLNYNDYGAFRRFAFIGFKSPESAEKAVEKLGNSFIRSSKITIEPCKAIKEIKPEKVGHKRNFDTVDCNEDDAIDESKNKKSNKTKKNNKGDVGDVFDVVKDDPEFKEYLKLQRNISENTETKKIWADDAEMNAEGRGISADANSECQTNDKPDDQSKAWKKHKRSRGKKKTNDKTKPKELFVHTAKVNGFPDKIRRKDVKDFFKPLEVLSVRINKRDGVCYVSFKDEPDLRFALRKNLHFYETNRLKVQRHDIKKSRVFREQLDEKMKKKQDSFKKYEASMADVEPVEESGRLFVRNLNYSCTYDDLEQVFSKYGEITEIHYPIDKNSSIPKGYAYVEFMFPESAAQAYQELNGSIFQGRNFHLIPSRPKPEPRPMFRAPISGPISGTEQSNDKSNARVGANQSSFKRDKINELKDSAARESKSKWNILFLGQNALADVVSEMKQVDKSKLLTEHSHKDPIAVRMALGDAMVVEEMRKFLVSNGVELDSFDNPTEARSKTVIIVKNLPASTDKAELSGLFERHGRVSRVIAPPNGLSAIVEMEEPVEAKLAFKRLAYSKFRDSILYLEWAPINVFRQKSLEDQEQEELKQMEQLQTGTKILVKNVPFEATVQELKKLFAAYGELNFVRIPKKVDGQHRGFGFVDFLLKEDALRAFRALCHSTHLYGRKLVLEWAKVAANERPPESSQEARA